MDQYRFTNVFRDLDRGTRWYILNIAKPILSRGLYLWNTVAYRMFNRIETAEAVGLPLHAWNWKAFEKTIYGLEHPFTGAHMTRLSIPEAVESLDKLWGARNDFATWIMSETTCEQAYSFLKWHIYGGGEFTAHQWVQDLRHTPILRHAADGPNWSVPGPGCKRGLKWMGQPPTFLGMMNVWLDQSQRANWVPWLEMKDVQQSLCEYQKYRKLYDMVNTNERRCKYRVFDTPERPLL